VFCISRGAKMKKGGKWAEKIFFRFSMNSEWNDAFQISRS